MNVLHFQANYPPIVRFENFSNFCKRSLTVSVTVFFNIKLIYIYSSIAVEFNCIIHLITTFLFSAAS